MRSETCRKNTTMKKKTWWFSWGSKIWMLSFIVKLLTWFWNQKSSVNWKAKRLLMILWMSGLYLHFYWRRKKLLFHHFQSKRELAITTHKRMTMNIQTVMNSNSKRRGNIITTTSWLNTKLQIREDQLRVATTLAKGKDRKLSHEAESKSHKTIHLCSSNCLRRKKVRNGTRLSHSKMGEALWMFLNLGIHLICHSVKIVEPTRN